MSLNDLTKTRQRRQAERRRRRQATREARRGQPSAPPPLPPTLEEYLTTWCKWPHEDTLEPTCTLNPPQADYLRRRTAFRRGPDDGRRRFGVDIVGKGRRSRFSSLGLGAIQYEIMREAELGGDLRALTAMQAGTDDILDPLFEQFGFALRHLPEPYRSRWESRGYSWRYQSKARWYITTSGNNARVAGKKGRAARWDILHLTDVGTWPHPDSFWDAAWPTIPKQTGSVYAESTFPGDPDHWMWRRWLAAIDGRDPQFLRAFFWPWHADPSRRIPRDHPAFEQALAVEVSEDEEERERELGLDIEQIAFRRQNRCGGKLSERRKRRREYPETPEEARESDGAQFLPEEDLQRFEVRVREPVIRERLSRFVPRWREGSEGRIGRRWSVSIWDPSPEAVIVGLDRATAHGRDYTAVVGLHPRTLEQVFEAHGRAIDSELADGVEEILRQLVGLSPRRYLIIPERNRCQGAIAEMQRRRLRLYTPQGASRPGFWTSATTRPVLIDRVEEAVTGDLCRLYSRFLVGELRGLRLGDDDRVEGHPHDDLVFALALALWAAPHTTWRLGSSAPWVPESPTWDEPARPA